MQLEKMTRAQMEITILEEDIQVDLDEAIAMSDDEMRELIRKWIEEGDETYQL